MKKILVVLAVPAMALGMGVTAQAAPSKGAASGATLNVSMNGALAAGSEQTAVFDGCGYAPGAGVSVKVVGPAATSIMAVAADAQGCITTADRVFPLTPGHYDASSWTGGRRAAATVSFNVAP
jgi:hypothetical protein